MQSKTKQWTDGSIATIQYGGQGDGEIIITSDANNHYEARSMQITVETTDGSGIQKTIAINQAAKQRIDISNAVVTASNQTYNGSAKTPTPTVTLNGNVIPSTGYVVAYSNNINAGTATITLTGKGDYTGTATGTFTIAQATGSVTTAPSARDVTYTGSSQYLVTAGNGTGTMYYRYKLSTSSSWSSWSTTRPSRTDAGTYNIEYYAAASSDGNYTQSATGSLNVEMTKAASRVSAAPTAKSLTYTGSAQNLVNAGTASGGTMYYKYTTTNSKPTSTSGFSSSIPTRTTAGTYYVWYYVAGDSNHTDTAISNTSVSVTISKASRTISFTSKPTLLDIDESATLAANVSDGSGDGTISFSSSNSSKASISGSTITGVANGTATITASVSAGTNYKAASTSYTVTVQYLDYIDLGLPSGTKWAKCNLGASVPEEVGDYYSWGNVSGHSAGDGYNFSTANYNSSPGSTLSTNIPTNSTYDAARANLGSPWRMPTESELTELLNNCNSGPYTKNGVGGRMFVSNINGKSIFMPYGGYWLGNKIESPTSVGCYFTNKYVDSDLATRLMFNSSGRYSNNGARVCGYPVRPVCS